MKFKSKSLISIILSIMMVMSMIIVAIPANAAVIDSVPVGADTYYLWYGSNDNPSIMTSVKMNASGNAYTVSIPSGNKEYDWTYFFISKGSQQSDHCWPDSKSTLDKSALNSMSAQTEFRTNTYDMYMIQLNAVINYLISYDGDNTVTVSEAGSTPTTPTKYNITPAATSNGLFTVSPTSAAAGTEVTVTTNPDSGYEVDKVTYTYGTTTDNATGSGNSYKFNMPASNVTVNVTFKESATPTAQYYIGGRFKVKDSGGTEHLTYDPTGNNNVWNASCTDINFKFIEDSSNSGWYYLNTNLTVAELSAQLSGKDSNGNAQSWYPYFLIHTGSGDSGTWYGAINNNDLINFENVNSLPATANLATRESNNAQEQLIKFGDTDSTITGNVTLHFNPTELKLYYTTDGTSTRGDFNIIDKTAANGKLTFSAPNKAAGTASADDEVTVTATPDKYFECTTIVVTYKDSKKVSHNIDATKTAANTFTFAVPSGLTKADIKDQEISVTGTFVLTSTGKADYIKDQGDGLWIDVAPDKNDTTATLIKWNNYKGKDQGTDNPYTFYVPKNVDLTNAKVYNGFDTNVVLNNVTIYANSCNTATLNIPAGTYSTSGATSESVKVMQGSTDAMFLHTTKEDGTDFDLPTKRNWPTDEGVTDKQASEYKAKIESSGGSCTTMDNTSNTANFSSAMGLDTVKGRGNSSWKASATMFGKYAFNMKLSSKTSLLGMDSAKSWCLLANNADESMMRNALIYQLAKEIGLPDSPEFRFVDIYDNGEYMGSYLVTEKVDVGSSKLVKGISYDDINEDYAKKSGLTEVDETKCKGTYNNNSTDNMQYAKVTANGITTNVPCDNTVADAKLKGKYLLEFEITERYQDEASWFTSPRGQHVVVKSPEFATKEQVEFIAAKFAEMEDIAFTTGATKAQLSTVMDVESFAKMYLIQEFSSNLDSASTSYYITFDCAQTNPVFVANPVWDYDWTCGQYNNQVGKKVDVDGTQLDTTGTNSWVAKNKAMDDSKNKDKGRSLQSQLAGTNVAFKSVVRKVWEETNGFYDKIQQYYSADGQITKWKDKISSSVNMNETRWGFIKDNLLTSWGTNDTGDTFDGEKSTVTALNTWVTNRATWLNKQFTDNSEYAPFTPATPASTVTDLNGTVKTSFEVGESFLINVTTVEDGVTYSVYLGETKVGDNVENGKIKVVATADMVGEQTFTVKATYGKKVETSNVIVTVNTSSDVKSITVYFKTATAPAYAPSVSFDGGDATAMTKSSELGKDYSGSLTFAWYSVTINDVDKTKNHTLTFTSKRTKLNATWNGTLTKDSYFTADNLMSGTVAVNLTDEHPIKRNFFYSATNMVYDSTDAKNKTLGFTFVGGSRVKMGTVVNESNGTVTPVSAPTVKSATYIQMINASMITVSSLQSELYDVNFDGKVDIKDATYIQYALAS